MEIENKEIDICNKNLKLIKNKPTESLKKMAKNEIYISRKRQQIEKFYYKRAYNLIFSQNFKEIFICGLGSCVNLAVKVALFILEALPNLSIESIETDSIVHVDDYINEDNDELVLRKEDRKSNLIRIKIIKK
jgi:hypothetical protein